MVAALVLAGCSEASSPAGPTDTPEPIVPTRTPHRVQEPPATSIPIAVATLSPADPTPTLTDTPLAPSPALSPEELARFGVAGALDDALAAHEEGLPFGATLNWRTDAAPALVPGVSFWQMLRLSDEGINPDWPEVERVLAAQPGSVWLVGNEPDVPWQDGITAERYAEHYHEAYTFIKERDPTAVIGAGGIAMPSPLRLAYLDDVLRIYETRFGERMPVDLWSIHAFTLREELDSWGIGIPPGRDETAGQLFEIEDHGDVDLFKKHVRDFREWMDEKGFRDAPLAVTEFGILLPVDYGFPEVLVAGYMRETIEFMRTATDEQIGLPSDDNRLVQFWFWYSLDDSGAYPTGDLFDPEAQKLTPLGEAYRDYLSSLPD